jgi:hypothetical protein
MLDEKAFLVSKKKKRPIFVAKKEDMDKKNWGFNIREKSYLCTLIKCSMMITKEYVTELKHSGNGDITSLVVAQRNVGVNFVFENDKEAKEHLRPLVNHVTTVDGKRIADKVLGIAKENITK